LVHWIQHFEEVLLNREGAGGFEAGKVNGMKRKFVWVGSALLTTVMAVAGCGGRGSGMPTSPTPPPTGGGMTITITASGVSPQNITVPPGTRVVFTNNDTQMHDMASDPHPGHTDCPEINQVGVLQPGQSRETGNLNTVRTCGFHDHDQPTANSLRGSIRIQ
jgi:plastocyanin